MFTLVAVHLFPLYFSGNKLKHPSECTILKVILKIDLRSQARPNAVRFINIHAQNAPSSGILCKAKL